MDEKKAREVALIQLMAYWDEARRLRERAAEIDRLIEHYKAVLTDDEALAAYIAAHYA
jgi:hypothetical protein